MDAEALRVLKLMPKWEPGTDENGDPARVSMTIPIWFKSITKEEVKE